MIHPTNSGLGKQIDLNENPQMPDTTGMRNPLNTSTSPTVSIGSFTINTPSQMAPGASLEKALLHAKKDSSNE